VWGKDAQRASEVAMQLEAGTVWVNKHLELPLDVPFGGAKQSGLGCEKGQKGLEEYTQVRIVNIGAQALANRRLRFINVAFRTSWSQPCRLPPFNSISLPRIPIRAASSR
jgi:hypothetical protein